MTKSEAIQEMQNGKKVTHRHFTSNEWMTIKTDKILFEDGVICTHDEFWGWRTQSSWNDGYSLFEN